MPRTARAIEAGLLYHVLNRDNGRMRLFYKPGDYAAFERAFGRGFSCYPINLLTYCITPNHWQLSCGLARRWRWRGGWDGSV